jgi:choline dehydrogenase-like flavoprotein
MAGCLFRPSPSSFTVIRSDLICQKISSCRMGSTDDETSCVDLFGKLWGCNNVYVWQRRVRRVECRHPTLPTVAIALRTADVIIAVLGSLELHF